MPKAIPITFEEIDAQIEDELKKLPIEYPDWSDVTWDFVCKVAKYVPGSIGWIARQQHNHEWTTVWGFVIGDKFGSADLNAMRNADDTFVRQIATEMLGYEPYSERDLLQRRTDAESRIAEIEAQIEDLRKSKTHYEQIRFETTA